MGLKLWVGQSERADVLGLVDEAVGKARERAAHPSVAIAFASGHYPADALAQALEQALSGIPWAGCTGVTAFAGSTLVERGLVLALVDGAEVRAGIGLGSKVTEGARAAGASATAEALGALGPSAGGSQSIVLLPDTRAGNGSEVVRGALSEGGSASAWAGGGAGDNLLDAPASQLACGRAHSDRVVALALQCPGRVGVGVQHGWTPYGPPVLVTGARGLVITELEYERAFDVYRVTAADQGDEVTPANFPRFAMTHPLGIPQASNEFLIRDPISVEPDGGLRLQAEVPEGAVIRIMQGAPAQLPDSAGLAARMAAQEAGGPLGGALVFDCVSRYQLLGEDFHRELRRCQEALGGVPLAGCLSFGEVGAFRAQLPQFHNKTTVVLALPG